MGNLASRAKNQMSEYKKVILRPNIFVCYWFACSHTTFPSFSPHHLVSLSPERSLGLLVSREAKKEAAKFKVVACASHCASHHQLVPTYSISLVIRRLCLSHERLPLVLVQLPARGLCVLWA